MGGGGGPPSHSPQNPAGLSRGALERRHHHSAPVTGAAAPPPCPADPSDTAPLPEGPTASRGRAEGLLAFGHPECWPHGFPAAATEIPPHQPAPRAGEGLGDSGLRSCLRPAPPRPPAPRHSQPPRGDHRSTLRHATGRYTGPSLTPQPIPHTRPHLDRHDRVTGEHDPARTPDRTRCDQKAGTPRLRPAGPHSPRRDGPGGRYSASTRTPEHASGGGAQTPRWWGRRTRVRAPGGVREGASIPSAIDPGGAEQTRPLASRSFVQWRAPPGRQEPRPLHGVWADGRRVGSRGRWWLGW
jgi:hypothetical protein